MPSRRKAAVSASSKRRSATRTSVNWSRARSRASGSAGSSRVTSARCKPLGRCASRLCKTARMAGSWMAWKSSSTQTRGSPNPSGLRRPEGFGSARGVEIVEQRGHQRRLRRQLAGQQRGQQLGADGRVNPLQGGHQVGAEAQRVVVGLLQRQPGHRLVELGRPLRRQRRLAIAGRRGDQCQRMAGGQPCVQPRQQSRPRHLMAGRDRPVELGGQQRGSGGVRRHGGIIPARWTARQQRGCQKL